MKHKLIMIINSLGEGGVRIQTSGTTIIIEPYKDKIPARVKADIFIKTTSNEDKVVADHIIKGPGEYEIKEVEIVGFHPFIYRLKAENLSLGFLGMHSSEDLTDIDILFVDGDSEKAKIIRQIEPKMVVVVSGKAEEIGKELGLKANKQEKITLKKKDLADQDMQLVQLK
jgi:hypothetical protein